MPTPNETKQQPPLESAQPRYSEPMDGTGCVSQKACSRAVCLRDSWRPKTTSDSICQPADARYVELITNKAS